jgi:hypothetical protein
VINDVLQKEMMFLSYLSAKGEAPEMINDHVSAEMIPVIAKR